MNTKLESHSVGNIHGVIWEENSCGINRGAEDSVVKLSPYAIPSGDVSSLVPS